MNLQLSLENRAIDAEAINISIVKITELYNSLHMRTFSMLFLVLWLHEKKMLSKEEEHEKIFNSSKYSPFKVKFVCF